jgi:hypothetical protein
MDYFISRDGQQYGPYTLSDLQRYVASGEVLLTDLATSEALTEPVSVAQIVGTVAAPTAFAASGQVSEVQVFPDPPNLHWGLVLLFTVVTCGFFGIVWEIVQAAWMKKIEPQSRSIYYLSAAALALIGVMAASFMHGLDPSSPNFTGLVQIVYSILVICGRFSFRSSMEDHFNGPEPMGLELSGVMTFFFGGIYFQYHINDIIRRKTDDRIYNATR